MFDVSPDLEDQMFRVLAAVLHLGNISYKEKADGSELEGGDSRTCLLFRRPSRKRLTVF